MFLMDLGLGKFLVVTVDVAFELLHAAIEHVNVNAAIDSAHPSEG